MKRLSVVGVVAVAALVGLTACSGGSPAPAPADSGAPAPEASGAPESGIALPESIKASGVLRIGTSPNFPPMEFIDDSGKMAGADIELMGALGEALGVKVEIVESPFDQLINSVTTGRVDVVMSGMSDTVERQKTGDFVDYFKSQGRLYATGAKAGEFTKQSDMCGKTVAVSAKTDFFQQVTDLNESECVANGLPKMTVLGTDSGSSARLQLDQGRAELAAQSAENLAYFDKTEPGKYAVVLEPLPAKPVAAFLKKGDSELANAVLAGFEAIIENGEYQRILDEWGIGYGAMEPVINGVTS